MRAFSTLIRLVSITIATLVMVAGVQQNDRLDRVDPDLTYKTAFGGSGADTIIDVAAASDGTIYLVGLTQSIDLPVFRAWQPTLADSTLSQTDAFVARINPTTEEIIFVTYLGGVGPDEAAGVSVDAADNVYVVGTTASADFPTRGAAQPELAGSSDAFVASFNPFGFLRFSTFFGGPDADTGMDIALDWTGAIWIVGETRGGIPAVDPILNPGGARDGYLAKLDPIGGTIVTASPLGGGNNDRAFSVTASSGGDLYVAGETHSGDFPSLGAFPEMIGAESDIFVMRFNPVRNELVYSARFGGTGRDEPRAMALDVTGRVYVSGITWSEDFPVSNPTQATLGGASDAILAVIGPDGDGLEFSTFLGAGSGDQAFDVAVLDDSMVTVVGQTFSSDFPANVSRLVDPGPGFPRSFATTYTGIARSSPTVVFSSTVPTTDRLNSVVPYQNGVLALGGSGAGDGFLGLLKLAEPPAEPPALTVTKTISEQIADSVFDIGERLTYTLKVENLGGPAVDVRLTDDFPEQARIVSASESPQTGPGTIFWDISVLKSREERTFTVTLVPESSTGEFNNVAWASEPRVTSDTVIVEGQSRPGMIDLVLLDGGIGGAVDIYIDSVLVADDFDVGKGVRATALTTSHLPQIDIVNAAMPDNRQSLESVEVDLFTGPDSALAFSTENILVVVESGDSLSVIARTHARFVAEDDGEVEFTIGHVAGETGAIDVTISGVARAVSIGLQYGGFTDYVAASAGIIDVSIDQSSDGANLGIWRFDLGETHGQAVTFLVAKEGAGKSVAVNILGFDAQGKRLESSIGTANEIQADFPVGFAVSPAYPNPASDRTRLILEIERPTRAVLRIYDALGRFVHLIEFGTVGRGRHEIPVEVRDLTPGLYHFRIDVDDASATSRVIVAR